ncbi:CARDB domain-containing protein, partial [Salinirubellus sp. GCM10025818]
TPEPATPTPEPATPTPEPATPTPEPATPTPEPEPAPETTLRLDPSSANVQPGQTTTYEIVVDSADGGVGAAEIGIAVDDTSVATITEATVLGSGDEEVDIAEDGSRVDIDYAFRDTMNSGSFPILEVTVEGQSIGDTSLSIVATEGNDEVLLFDEGGTGYDVTGTAGATLSVQSGGGATPTPEPATPTPEPATPTPEPATPTPEPATPTPEPATPTPEPATPTPEPATPTPTPAPAAANFEVSNLQAPGSITQGDLIDVSATVENTGGQTATKSVEFRVDTDNDGSIADESAVLSRDVELAPGESKTFSFEDVDTSGLPVGTLTHGVATPDDSATARITVEAPEPKAPAYFQFDLVEGEVIEQLDPDEGDTYHKQDRFIMALIISEDEQQRGGAGTPMHRTYQAEGCEVTYSWLSFDNTTGQSQVAVSVADAGGCEGITLSYAGYELPDGATGWDADRAEEQELKDSITVTLNPGEEEVLTVDVTPEEPGTPNTPGQLIGHPAGGL